jgi:hypothetical protein
VPQDYTEFVELAQELIEDFGRQVTITRRNNTTPVDPARPWKGYTDADTEVTPIALFLPEFGQLINTEDYEEFAQLVREEKDTFLVAKGSVPSSDLTTFDKLIDGGDVYSIDAVREFKPGGTVIFYAVDVSA